MAGTVPLKFQYQERGPALSKAIDPAHLARMHERRDQDLENYLATLKSGGARVSIAVYNGPPSTVVASGTTVEVDLAFSVGTEGLATADTTGFVPKDPTLPFQIYVSTGGVIWASTGSTTPGICQVGTQGLGADADNMFILTHDTGLIVTSQSVSQIQPWPFINTAAPSLPWFCNVEDIDLGIPFSGGTLHGVTELQVGSPFVFIYIVD